MIVLPATLMRAPQRRRLYDFIILRSRDGGTFPTKAEICAAMGWRSETSAHCALTTLWQLDGVIDRDLLTGVWRVRA